MLRVYNTLTREKEAFKPLVAGKVSIYCCGVTPYNDPHIGNARPFVTWDVVRRYLEKKGYAVRYVQNFTDVDDKIIRRAKEAGKTWKELADHYIEEYFKVLDALNVRRADIYPRVSEHIGDVLAVIERLIEKGYAYVLDGDVYYSVEHFAGYGRLSGRSLEDMQAGARVGIDERKKHPMDFALWKAVKLGEPFWDSPWGKGRPGWHIECSTMAMKYLGETFDFHGGGSDLIFPHHENEIAQAKACTGDEKSFARYWLHNGFITIHDEKMSKSKNNFFTVKDILKKYPGEVVRFFIVQTHYRSPLDFTDERLKEAKTSLARLKISWDNAAELKTLDGADSNSAKALLKAAAAAKAAFYEAMEDDFNTALAISHIFSLSKEINTYYSNVTKGNIAFDAADFAKVHAIYTDMAKIIGIFETKAERKDDGLVASLINLILALRQKAREEKNWALADRLRDELKACGIIIEDTPQGARWKRT